MFEFSEYTQYKEVGILKDLWKIKAPKAEINARKIFNELDFDKLKTHLESVIKKEIKNVNINIDKNYSKKIIRLKNKYPVSSIYKSEKIKFETKLLDCYSNDTSVYKVAYKMHKEDENKLIDAVIELAIERINDLCYYIDKLIYITEFKTDIENSVLWSRLYELIKSPQITLKDLFKSENKYIHVITLLHDNNIIEEIDLDHIFNIGVVIFNKELNENNLSEPKLVSAFGYLLYVNNLLNATSKLKISYGLKQFFNIQFSNEAFRKNFLYFDQLDNIKKSDYINYFHFLLKLKE